MVIKNNNMKKGYIELQIDEKSKKLIKNWFKKTKITTVDKKIKNKLHLTLFFGLDYSKVKKQEIEKKIKKIKIKEILIKGINYFPVENYDFKIFYLEIKDVNKKLLKLHNAFLNFPHLKDNNTHNFKPHITLGYVNGSIKSKKIKYTGPKILSIKGIKYKIFNK